MDDDDLVMDGDQDDGIYHALNSFDCRSAPTVMVNEERDELTSYGMPSAATSIIHETIYGRGDATLIDNQTLDDVPADFEWAITFNQDMIDGVNRQIQCVEKRLAIARQRRQEIETSLYAPTNSKSGKKKLVKIPALIFMPPYFKDPTGMAPPRTKDSQLKVERGEFDPLTQPPRKFSVHDVRVMKEAVRKDVMSSLKRPLNNRVDLLKEKRPLVDAQTLHEIDIDIAGLNKQIRKIERLSEDELLSRYNEGEIDWLTMANNAFKGARTPNECRAKWVNELCPPICKSHWTKSEITKLKQLVEASDHPNWQSIAHKLKTKRTALQCFEKYQTDINTKHIKQEWSVEEDKQLKEIVNDCQMDKYICWDLVSYYMEGRTRAQCMFRYQRSLQEGTKRGRWEDDEDLLLMLAVNKIGAKEWSKVAALVPNRTDAQCRERWSSCLDHKVKVGDWTTDEDEILLLLCKLFGQGEWSRICRVLPNRTSQQCKSRFKQLRRGDRASKIVQIGIAMKNGDSTIAWETPKLTDKERHKMNKRGSFVTQRKEEVRDRFASLVGMKPEDAMPWAYKNFDTDTSSTVYDFLKKLPPNVATTIHCKLAKIKYNQIKQKVVKQSEAARKSAGASRPLSPMQPVDELFDFTNDTPMHNKDHIDLIEGAQYDLRQTLRGIGKHNKTEFYAATNNCVPHAKLIHQYYSETLASLYDKNDVQSLPLACGNLKLLLTLLRKLPQMQQAALKVFLPNGMMARRGRVAAVLAENMEDMSDDEKTDATPPMKRTRFDSAGDCNAGRSSRYKPVINDRVKVGVKDMLLHAQNLKLWNGENQLSKFPGSTGPFIPAALMKKIAASPNYNQTKDVIRCVLAWPMLASAVLATPSQSDTQF